MAAGGFRPLPLSPCWLSGLGLQIGVNSSHAWSRGAARHDAADGAPMMSATSDRLFTRPLLTIGAAYCFQDRVQTLLSLRQARTAGSGVCQLVDAPLLQTDGPMIAKVQRPLRIRHMEPRCSVACSVRSFGLRFVVDDDPPSKPLASAGDGGNALYWADSRDGRDLCLMHTLPAQACSGRGASSWVLLDQRRRLHVAPLRR